MNVLKLTIELLFEIFGLFLKIHIYFEEKGDIYPDLYLYFPKKKGYLLDLSIQFMNWYRTRSVDFVDFI